MNNFLKNKMLNEYQKSIKSNGNETLNFLNIEERNNLKYNFIEKYNLFSNEPFVLGEIKGNEILMRNIKLGISLKGNGDLIFNINYLDTKENKEYDTNEIVDILDKILITKDKNNKKLFPKDIRSIFIGLNLNKKIIKDGETDDQSLKERSLFININDLENRNKKYKYNI